ncbi:MAG: DUF2442 domain-containing protein [Fibromonadaceae bacterium]|jgi:hypothetical protein|nr:DUF2442 domain-containing protein [Fibromonadaceae bacterium]
MKISKIWFSEKSIFLETDSGRVMSAELWRFPRLMRASEEQTNDWEQFYDELRWESIDEDIGLKSFELNGSEENVVRFL